MTVLSASQTKKVVEASVSLGVSEIELMRGAGEATARFICEKMNVADKNIVFLCGSGGNGGDGFAAAVRLAELGAKPVVILCTKVPTNKASLSFYKVLLKQATPVFDALTDPATAISKLRAADVAIDAVFGAGYGSSFAPELRPIFAAFNSLRTLKISLDLPSGVNPDTGESDPACARPDFTLCFVTKKPAHVLKRSAYLCGEIVLADIGVPKKAFAQIKDPSVELTRDFVRKFLPPKNPTSHKGVFGRLLCVCGSESYRGAAVLSAMGAVRCGAGIVEVASCEAALFAVASHLAEPILYDIFSNDINLFVERVQRASAIVLGCGLSRTEDAQKLVELTLLSSKAPLVLDADGINAISSNIKLIEETASPLILTPHLGEFSELCKTPVAQLAENRFAAARYFAASHKCVLVLKSENTVIAAPKGEVFVISNGNAGLAKGGSGDLLSGMIGAFCAMGLAPLSAAILGAYLHAEAADIAVRDINEYALTATDVAGYISRALDSLIKI